jgi:tetratricopeptide (TPR) repeat protein
MVCRFLPLNNSGYYLLLLLFLVNCIIPKSVAGKLSQGMSAPSFTLRNLKGESETLADLRNGKKLTTIVFWATWNEQSIKELKRLQKTYEKYQSAGFQVIAINVEDQNITKTQLEKITTYCEEIGITFPVLIDENLETFQEHSVIAIPTTFLINAEEIIVYKLPGYPLIGAEELFSTIRKIIEPASVMVPSERRSKTPNDKALRYYQMAKILRENENYPGAIESLRKSILHDQDFLAAYNQLGVLLYQEGQQREAIDIYKRALARNPDDLHFRADYGNFLLDTGDEQKGLAMIRKILEDEPNFSTGHYYLGNYFLKQGKKDEALINAQSAVQLNPLDFTTHLLLGNVYEVMGKKKESLAAYKKAADLLERKVKPKYIPSAALVLNSTAP